MPRRTKRRVASARQRLLINESSECLFGKHPLDGSDEHVILNAVGGRKSSTKILCATCNNSFGSTIDAALLSTLEPFTLIIDPPTRRRSIGSRKRVLDAKGIEYEISAGGKLKVRYKQLGPNQWVANESDTNFAMRNAKAAAAALESRTGEKVCELFGAPWLPEHVVVPEFRA